MARRCRDTWHVFGDTCASLGQIAHVIRENRRFQQTPYKIEYNAKVSAYLLDASACSLSNDDLYEM